MLILQILFFFSAFMIFWAMIGYPAFIKCVGKIFVKRNKMDYSYLPSVTVMIVVHNEEKVIRDKLENIIKLNYPKEKLKILVTSDDSTDKTNLIVEEFVASVKESVQLYKVRKRMGKTNAQNEAQKLVESEILVMTDANAMLDRNAIRELVACFSSEDIAYVCGVLKYINKNDYEVSSNENSYWDNEVIIRDIEGNIQGITAGNGALYACRNTDYYDFPPIQSHDSGMPFLYALQGKRAINCMTAVAYEKAGETNKDEFNRKVRMNRGILNVFKRTWKVKNIFKYKWFTFFYFGHRTCRNLLWLNHLILIVVNTILTPVHVFYTVLMMMQILLYTVSGLQYLLKLNNKYLSLLNYYFMTILAQWLGVYNTLTGKVKPTWEKAKSTR